MCIFDITIIVSDDFGQFFVEFPRIVSGRFLLLSIPF